MHISCLYLFGCFLWIFYFCIFIDSIYLPFWYEYFYLLIFINSIYLVFWYDYFYLWIFIIFICWLDMNIFIYLLFIFIYLKNNINIFYIYYLYLLCGSTAVLHFPPPLHKYQNHFHIQVYYLLHFIIILTYHHSWFISQ